MPIQNFSYRKDIETRKNRNTKKKKKPEEPQFAI